MIDEMNIEGLARGTHTLSRGGALIRRKFAKRDWPDWERAKTQRYCTSRSIVVERAFWDWCEVHQRPAVLIRPKRVWASVVVDLITACGVTQEWIQGSWVPALKQLVRAAPTMRDASFGTWSQIRVRLPDAEDFARQVVRLWDSMEDQPKFENWRFPDV